ncbi:DUF4416 family protein [bacterium]|nr:DUF4416 family protein [bacterium]
MGEIRPVTQGALIVGITFTDECKIENSMNKLVEKYGPVAFMSDVFDFTMTDYYTAEMGENLKKRFCCFERPIGLESLPDIKLFTNAIETEYARSDGERLLRTVNIDPGYVILSKLVLATTKDYSHRIYIGRGIYAEVTLRFLKDSFAPLDHTYPDYQTPLAIGFFNEVRDFLKRNRYRWMTGNESSI